jgi:hypothetical protein
MISKSCLKVDKEIFKKHFAKNIGTDFINERVSSV